MGNKESVGTIKHFKRRSPQFIVCGARGCVQYHVFQNGAKADGAEDLGLALGRQSQALGVAPAQAELASQ